MAERFKSDLPYGHFGRANYSLDGNAWDFVRRLERPSQIQPLDNPELLTQVSANTHTCSPALEHGAKLRQRHERQIRALVKSNPDLEATSDLLANHLRISELVQDAVQRHDSSKGSLISVSNISSESRNRPISVAAYATGIDGSDVCLMRMQPQKRGWTGNDKIWLEVPTMHGEQMILPGQGSPILQLRFAASLLPGNAMLAVRTQEKVAIFHPAHRKASPEGITGSRLSLEPLYTVPVRVPKGAPWADVAFNPWFPQQLAVIDQDGNWKVLEFRTRKMDRVARKWEGSSLDVRSSSNDGWAKIAWITNIETVAICTRKALKLINISADDPKVVEDVGVDLSGTVPWILDFVVVPGHTDRFVVLTTTNIILYGTYENPSGGKLASVLLKVRHFRSPEDTTLRLKASKDEDGLVLMLRSSTLKSLIGYRMQFSEGSRVVLGAPFRVDLISGERNDEPSPISDVHIQPVKTVLRPGTQSPGNDLSDSRFFVANIITGDNKALECLLYDAAGHSRRLNGLPGAPDKTKKLNISTSKLKLSNFIVDDPTVEVEEGASPRVEPLARRRRKTKPRLRPTERTIDLERITDLLQHPIEEPHPFEEVLESIQRSLSGSNPDEQALQTLHSFADAELIVGDTHVGSEALESLMRSQPAEPSSPIRDVGEVEPPSQRKLVLRSLCTPVMLGLSHDLSGHDLSAAYNEIVLSWITSLPANIPGRVRLAKAKVASVVAADLILSCNILRPEDPADRESHADGPLDSQDRLSQEPSSSLPSFSQQASALPTPSITPSITTGSSHPSTFAAPELLRLSKYTTFTKPAPTILPRPLTKVLAHGKLGTAPSDYDWMSTSRNLTRRDEEEEDEEMPEKERKRMQRRAERHIRRQRKEAAASEQMALASSQAAEIFSASQPVLASAAGRVVESQPSAVAESSQMTRGGGFGEGATSQVVAGRYGGRPPAKKKRKQGF